MEAVAEDPATAQSPLVKIGVFRFLHNRPGTIPHTIRQTVEKLVAEKPDLRDVFLVTLGMIDKV